MTSTFSHIAVVLAGLAIVATGFTVMPRSLLKGTAAAVALGIVAALLITAVRSFGWHSNAASLAAAFILRRGRARDVVQQPYRPVASSSAETSPSGLLGQHDCLTKETKGSGPCPASLAAFDFRPDQKQKLNLSFSPPFTKLIGP
jgi:hypothetical protein